MAQKTYDIFDLGLDKAMNRQSGLLSFIPEDTTPVGALSSTIPSSAPISKTSAGETPQITYVAKQSFTDTANGMRQGLDSDGTYKWIIGTTGNSVDFNVTTANTLTISGALSASTIDIGGADATSFHVDIDGNMWLGAATFAAGVFRVSNAGALTATSGTFGNWTISGNSFTTTADNIFIGNGTGASITTGARDICLGTNSGNALTDGSFNVLVGYNTGNLLTRGSSTFIGYNAGLVVTTAQRCTLIGFEAGVSITTDTIIGLDVFESRAVCVGYQAGDTITDGWGNICIGSGSDISSGSNDNSIVIGTEAVSTASSQMVIGSATSPINDVYIGEGVTSTTPSALLLHATGASGANVAGANFTIAGSQSTGSAAGGSLIFQTSPAGGAGSSLNALVTALTIDSTGAFTFAGAGGLDFASKAMTNVNIDSGAIDGTTIGAASAAAITGTTITGTSFVIGANTLTTTEWAFLDGIDQTVATTSSPTFNALTLTTDLSVANGGTGASTFTTDGVLYGAGTSAIAATAQGGTRTILTANAGAPAWSASPIVNTSLQAGVAGSSQGSFLLAGLTSGTITITTAAAAGTYTLTLPTTDGTASQFLQTDGAGVLTWATVSTTITTKNGTATRAGNTASGTQNIAHGLGVTPTRIRISATWAPASTGQTMAVSDGFYNVTSTSCSFAWMLDGTSNGSGVDTTNMVNLNESGSLSQVATVTVDATNIVLTWTRTGATASATMNLSWEVS